MKPFTREEALEVARTSLRRTLEPLGADAQAAIELPEYQPTVRAYIEAAWSLSDAWQRFRGTAEEAQALERAAAAYGAALAAVQSMVAKVTLQFVTPAGPAH